MPVQTVALRRAHLELSRLVTTMSSSFSGLPA